MAERHHFKLKLPNGAEVDFGGDKEFVTEVYRDTKSAAVTLFNQEAARTTPQQAVDRLMATQDQALPGTHTQPGPTPPLPQLTNKSEGPGGEGAKGAGPVTPNAKPRKPSSKPDEAQRVAKNARKNEISTIIKAQTFEDDALYTGAIRSAETALDRACVVVCLARDKFKIENGLRPFEVLQILNDRFRVGQEKSSLKKAMKDAPTTIFLDGPADFDKAARLYRSMEECDAKVQRMLDAQRTPRMNMAAAPDGNGAPV